MKNPIDHSLAVVDSHDSHLGSLPLVLKVHFRKGDIVFEPEAVTQALQLFPFILEGVGVRKKYFQIKKADNHFVVAKRKLSGWAEWKRHPRQERSGRFLLDYKGLDEISYLNIVKPVYADAAFVFFFNFGDVFF